METLRMFHLFAGRSFSIAAWQMTAIAIFYGWAIFSGRLKLGLILFYFLAVYWVFIANRVFWVAFFGGQFVGIFSYAVVCLIMVMVGMAGLFRESH